MVTRGSASSLLSAESSSTACVSRTFSLRSLIKPQLLPSLGHCEKAAVNIGAHGSLQKSIFKFGG